MQLHKELSDEECFLFEEKNELRHELINGNLYEIGGRFIFHINIVRPLFVLAKTLPTACKVIFLRKLNISFSVKDIYNP